MDEIKFRLPRAGDFEAIDLRCVSNSVGLPADQSERDAGQRKLERVEAFLLASLQVEHLAALSGSGTSITAGGPSMAALWKEALEATLPDDRRAVFEAVGYEASAPVENDIEDLLSRCDAVLQIRPNDVVRRFRERTLDIILRRCRVAGHDHDSVRPHEEFLRRLARRRARDSRLKLFTTNYDLCFDIAASRIGLVPLDGLSFGYPRRFDARFFEYDIVRRTGSTDTAAFVPGVFLYFKLHGSVDWAFGADGGIEVNLAASAANACLIYPARSKYQLSFQQPHLELMAQYLDALRQPNTSLVVAGFGFNDDHLCAPIFSALRSNPHFRLIVVDRSAEKKFNHPETDAWKELRRLADQSRDIAFFSATFEQFVRLIPDLRALTPAERLERAVRGLDDSR